jgi:hypothetical protein
MGEVKRQIMQMAATGQLPGPELEFSLNSPVAVVRQPEGRGTRARPSAPNATEIAENRLIADTDPHVGEGIHTLVDYLIGSGYSIEPVNIVGLPEQEQTDEDIADLKYLIETSPTFELALDEWVWHALVDGTAFMEIVVEDGVFKPKVVPTEAVEIVPDKFGHIVEYLYTGSDGVEKKLKPGDLAILRFHRHPGDDYGQSLVRRIREQADMLRDMELDTARFIATKAYPPIIWRVGSEERPWTQPQINAWLNTVQQIEPESMLAVGHDVEHDVVGATSTSSTSGAMRLEPMFEHLMTRIYTGLGLPAFLGNINTDSARNEAVSMMPKFDRRIQRYRRIIRNAIRQQIFLSIMAGESDISEISEVPPDFIFGQHSSEEERLDAELAIKLVNNGLLTFEAAATRIGIDPETEMPTDAELDEHMAKLAMLAGVGDDIQHRQGGAPTETGAGTESSGRAVQTRQNPERETTSRSRPQRSVDSE